MGNIIVENEKRENLLKAIGGWGFYLFILTGIVGCSVVESFTMAYGGVFVIIGIFVDYYVTRIKDNFKKDGGALTRRRLVDADLRGLKKDELERLRLHIYAKNGYNFDVNDGLYYLDKIAKKYFPNYRKIETYSELELLCESTGYNKFEVLASNAYRLYSSKPIDEMSEKEKDNIRKEIEESKLTVDDYEKSVFHTYEEPIGYFNRDGKYSHEGKHFYDFKDCEWYKPTTNNLDEVYSKMSEIEKYNVEFIKAREDEMN